MSPKVRIIVSCPESCVWLSSVCWTEGMHESIHSFDCSDNAIICGDIILYKAHVLLKLTKDTI